MKADASKVALITVDIYGQYELGLPVKVEITDGNKVPIRDEGINFSVDQQQVRLYATVTYSGGTTISTVDSAIDNLEWGVSNSELGYIESRTGYYIARDDGIVKVTASLPTGVKDESIRGSIWITTDTGKYGGNDPGGSGTVPANITVQVMFEDDETKTFVSA